MEAVGGVVDEELEEAMRYENSVTVRGWIWEWNLRKLERLRRGRKRNKGETEERNDDSGRKAKKQSGQISVYKKTSMFTKLNREKEGGGWAQDPSNISLTLQVFLG